MPDSADTNEAIWKSDAAISHWVSTAEDRERRRADERRLMAELLPFDKDQQFTFIDLGAGTGAAARVVLDYFPGARAILADYSLQMMEQGRRRRVIRSPSPLCRFRSPAKARPWRRTRLLFSATQ